jgi:hypothetical protein
MSTAAVFLDIEKAFDTTWHPGLLYVYTLSELQFSASLVKLIASLLTNRKFQVSVKGGISTPRKVAAGVSQGSVLAPVFFSLLSFKCLTAVSEGLNKLRHNLLSKPALTQASVYIRI